MSNETQFKHNARGNMDLNKKRDELAQKRYNKWSRMKSELEERELAASEFITGFDAAVEILSAEIKELDRLFRLAREQRNEAEDKIKELENINTALMKQSSDRKMVILELEKAFEFYANKENWLESKSHKGFFEVMQEQDCEVFDKKSGVCGKLARQTLSKLRGGK